MILYPAPTIPGTARQGALGLSGSANRPRPSAQGWPLSLRLARMRVGPGSDSLDRLMRASGSKAGFESSRRAETFFRTVLGLSLIFFGYVMDTAHSKYSGTFYDDIIVSSRPTWSPPEFT